MTKRPTAAELELLQVLWDRGPSTVRAVHESLRPERATSYTTTLKLLQIMAEKDLVTRDEAQRAHVYAARQPRERVQTQLVRELVDGAFGGSASRLVMNALSSKRATARELAEIRRLLDEAEGSKR